MVMDGKGRPASAGRRADGHGLCGVTVLEGIRYEVGDDLREAIAVPVSVEVTAAFQDNLPARMGVLELVDRFDAQRAKFPRLPCNRDAFAESGAREIQKVVDQP